MLGVHSDAILNQKLSQQTLALDPNEENLLRTDRGGAMSLPKIKEVKVSPNLKFGGMSARQRSILLSQNRLAKFQFSRAQTKLRQQRGYHTIDNISTQSNYPIA